jgi:hypothetical protein
MSDDAFARLVSEDVKNRVTTQQREYLRLPDNWGRWREALNEIASNLADQLKDLDGQERQATERFSTMGTTGAAMLVEAQATIAEKRERIERFNFYVEQRLAEVDRLEALGAEELPSDLKLAEFLSRAIEEHRRILGMSDLNPTELDEALWAALDGHWNFANIDPDAL